MPMAKPILHGPAYSSHVRVVRLCLAEKNVAYDMQDVDLLRGAAQARASQAASLRQGPGAAA